MPKEAITVNLDQEIISAVDNLGALEDRNRSNMFQVLLREAIAARDKKDSNDEKTD